MIKGNIISWPFQDIALFFQDERSIYYSFLEYHKHTGFCYNTMTKLQIITKSQIHDEYDEYECKIILIINLTHTNKCVAFKSSNILFCSVRYTFWILKLNIIPVDLFHKAKRSNLYKRVFYWISNQSILLV